MKRTWIQLRSMKDLKVLLILPCNAGACIGNYFRADLYSPKRWNTWLEADGALNDLRRKKLVGFAAVDSSTLETQPGDARGAIVFETEMNRVRNPKGEDWGAPSWRFFRPNLNGKWPYLEELTEALVKGIRRVRKLGFLQVLALVNPRGYFLALGAAAKKCGVLDSWVLFRVPAHPNYLMQAVGEATPFVRASASGHQLTGGIYPVPQLYSALEREAQTYNHNLPEPWLEVDYLPGINEVTRRWNLLRKEAENG
jgi:hypothetical protein